jgi:hypothetical protein
MLKRIPAALIAFHAAAAVLVLPLGWYGWGTVLALVILLATPSDIFDDIIARRLGVSTAGLRRADRIVDLIFWLSVTASLRPPSGQSASVPPLRRLTAGLSCSSCRIGKRAFPAQEALGLRAKAEP